MPVLSVVMRSTSRGFGGVTGTGLGVFWLLFVFARISLITDGVVVGVLEVGAVITPRTGGGVWISGEVRETLLGGLPATPAVPMTGNTWLSKGNFSTFPVLVVFSTVRICREIAA